MTVKTHLDTLLEETTGDLGKKLIDEFIKLVRDPQATSSSYPTQLRAVLEEELRSAEDAAG
jgi:hypothetical protein